MYDEFEQRMTTMIQNYLKETRGQILTKEEVWERPLWKRVWFYWKALEHFEDQKMPDLTIEEVKVIYKE